MQQRLLRFAFLAALVACCPLPVSAAPIVIDFETLSEGDDLNALGLGVAFSNATLLTAEASGNELDFPPRSGTKVVVDNGGPMRLDFSAPISSFSGYFTYVAPLTIQFFDLSTNLLGAVTSLFDSNFVSSGNGSPNELLSGAFANIAYVTITGAVSGPSFTLDDVSFEIAEVNAVPEPSTIVLIGIGMAALVRYRRSPGRRGAA